MIQAGIKTKGIPVGMFLIFLCSMAVFGFPAHMVGHWLAARLVGARPTGLSMGAGEPLEASRVLGIHLVKRERPAGLSWEPQQYNSPSWPRRLVLILSGSLANYLAAVLAFVGFVLTINPDVRTALLIKAPISPLLLTPTMARYLTTASNIGIPAPPGEMLGNILTWIIAGNLAVMWLTMLSPFRHSDGGRLWATRLLEAIGRLIARRLQKPPDQPSAHTRLPHLIANSCFLTTLTIFTLAVIF